jgi:diadenosine tetraphosphate (Ap4A) HIT family hydrolase
MSEYDHLLIKDYRHWGLYIYSKQNYLGRCVIWCKREDALTFTDMTGGEYGELMTVIKDWESAVFRTFGANWFNQAFLGNITRHLHGHLIPRYKEPVMFGGVKFVDEEWGQMYRTDHDFIVSDELLESVRVRLQAAIDSSGIH